MNLVTTHVLSVGKRLSSTGILADRLHRWGCETSASDCCGHALKILDLCRYEIVLSEAFLSDGSARKLVPALIGTSAYMFSCYPVEYGCWWLPQVKAGHDCAWAPALRPPEFAHLLRGLLCKRIENSLIVPAGPKNVASYIGTRSAGTLGQAY
jgi:hypothetical protein